MPKFYGDKEIEEIKDAPSNPANQILVFKDKSEFEITKKMADAVVGDKPINATELRDKRCISVVSNILEIFLDWDIHISEIDFINQRVIMSINESLKKADEMLWKKELRLKSMSDVNKILLSAPNDSKPIESPYPNL